MAAYDVALLTDARYEKPDQGEIGWYVQNILDEDALIRAGLQRRGLSSIRVDWARTDFDWGSVRCAVFRTTWDYFERPSEFSAWLDRAAAQTQLINPCAQVRWNMDKHYLLDLDRRGIRTVPHHFIERGSRVSLGGLMGELGWSEIVLKPAISGAARHTYRVSRRNAPDHDLVLAELLERECMLVQPFQREIVESGELTLVVLGGKVTHAVQKIAKAGDFRVQDDHGGTVHPHEPSVEEIAFAERAVAACDPLPVYARVDLVRDNEGELAIMELELVEPELFFRFQPRAADAFAACLSQCLSRSAGSK